MSRTNTIGDFDVISGPPAQMRRIEPAGGPLPTQPASPPLPALPAAPPPASEEANSAKG